MSAAPTPLYPLFLRLEGERGLVVGGGAIAAQKAKQLALSGAAVDVVAKRVHPPMDALARAYDNVTVRTRPFAPADAAGARVVIAATEDTATNRAVYDAGRAAGALCNVVDVLPLCDFHATGVVRRGPVTVAIGTGGTSPALARWVRRFIEGALPKSVGPLALAMGRARPRLLARHPDFGARAKLFAAFVEDAMARFQRGEDPERAADWIDTVLLAPDARADEGGTP